MLSWVKEARNSNNTNNNSSESTLPTVSDLARRRAGLGGETSWGGTSSGAADEGSYAQPLAEFGHEIQQLSRTNTLEYILEDTTTFTGLEETLWPLGAPTTAAASEKWTYLTSDPILIRHLMAL
jgi:hypothetical protein